MQSFHNYLKDLNNPKTKDLIKDTIYYDAQIPNISANLNKGIQPRGKNYNNFDELHNRANEGLDIIDGIQKGMNTFKINDDDDFPIKIDGKFGAKTQSAWDRYAKANIPDKPNYLQGIIAPKKPPSLNIFQDKSPAAARFREKAFDDLLKQLRPESAYKTMEYRFPDYENWNEKNQSKAENLPYIIPNDKDRFENAQQSVKLLNQPSQGVYMPSYEDYIKTNQYDDENFWIKESKKNTRPTLEEPFPNAYAYIDSTETIPHATPDWGKALDYAAGALFGVKKSEIKEAVKDPVSAYKLFPTGKKAQIGKK